MFIQGQNTCHLANTFVMFLIFYVDVQQHWKCCDYNFVYTLFPAHILHNMDIIIGLVLCTPQSCFVTLR